jgi:integrase
LSVDQVFALADLVPNRWKAFVLLKTFASLRWGEITALTRADVDLVACSVRIRRQMLERSTGAIGPGPTKSRAGNRTVAFPAGIGPAIAAHLADFAGPRRDDLVSGGLAGQPLRRSNFNKSVDWHKVTAEIGAPGLHLHDLRHTGNTLAASTGCKSQGPDDSDGARQPGRRAHLPTRFPSG